MAGVQMLLEMIDPDDDFSLQQPQNFGMGTLRAQVLFETLERQGVVASSGYEYGDEYWVPESLRPAVAQALLNVSRRLHNDDADYPASHCGGPGERLSADEALTADKHSPAPASRRRINDPHGESASPCVSRR